MIDHGALHLALRARAETLSVCTTGSATLAATATGYTRAAGSFVTDGFKEGMEINPSGFTNAVNNERAIVTRVEALTLTVRESRITEASASGRTIAVGLPEDRADENVAFEPDSAFPYIEEDYVRGPRDMISMPYNNGYIRETGMYSLNWYFLPDYDSFAIHKCVDALLALFTPGTTLTADGETVHVSGQPGPSATQPEPDGEGWVVVSIDIPFYAVTTNAVAA